MGCLFAALMPHPPVILPEVGKGREQEAAHTLAGLQALHDALQPVLAGTTPPPEYLVLLSPHQPYARGALFLNEAPQTRGGFAHFGAPSVTFSLSTPLEALKRLQEHLDGMQIPVATGAIEDITRDHATFVPLYYLKRMFPHAALPPVLVASPIGLSYRQSLQLGQALAAFDQEHTWGLVASGDLSHRLTPNAPAGFSPQGAVFDKAVVDAVKAGNADMLLSLAPEIIEQAGECGMRSVLAMIGLANGPAAILSYEGPFGVGYCTALWRPA